MNSPIPPLKRYLQNNTDTISDPKTNVTIKLDNVTGSRRIELFTPQNPQKPDILYITESNYPELYEILEPIQRILTTLSYPDNIDIYTMKFTNTTLRIRMSVFPTSVHISTIQSLLKQSFNIYKPSSFRISQVQKGTPVYFQKRNQQDKDQYTTTAKSTLYNTLERAIKPIRNSFNPATVTANIDGFSVKYNHPENTTRIQLKTNAFYPNIQEIQMDSYLNQF